MRRYREAISNLLNALVLLLTPFCDRPPDGSFLSLSIRIQLDA